MSDTVCFEDRPVLARKPHTCDWCGEPIGVGERCQYARGKNEGVFYESWMHPECSNAFAAFVGAGFEEWTPGSFKRGTAEER